MNIWTGDGFKDIPADRMGPRIRYKEAIDEILSEPFDFNMVKPCVESKVFGIGVEAYNDAMDIPTVQPNAITRRHQHMAHTGVEEFKKLTDVPAPVGKLLLEGDHELLQQAHDYLHAQPWSGEYEVIFSGVNLLEVTAKGANKGGMVRRLAQRLDIPMDHVYCIGDETNDISMLTMAKEGFAPANCVQAVRDCGATIVSDKNHDALADVIQILDKYY